MHRKRLSKVIFPTVLNRPTSRRSWIVLYTFGLSPLLQYTDQSTQLNCPVHNWPLATTTIDRPVDAVELSCTQLTCRHSLTGRWAWPISVCVQTRLLSTPNTWPCCCRKQQVKRFEAVQIDPWVRSHVVVLSSLVQMGGAIHLQGRGQLVMIRYSLTTPPPPIRTHLAGLPTAGWCRGSAWPSVENNRGSPWDFRGAYYSHVAK